MLDKVRMVTNKLINIAKLVTYGGVHAGKLAAWGAVKAFCPE
jgi:hypothetical protein